MPIDALWTLSWRAWPATVLVLGGLALAVRGTWAERRGIARPVTDARKGVALVRALRAVVVGLAVAAMGAAWVWQLETLFLVGAVIGGEELLETSVVIAALDDAERRGIWSAPGDEGDAYARKPRDHTDFARRSLALSRQVSRRSRG